MKNFQKLLSLSLCFLFLLAGCGKPAFDPRSMPVKVEILELKSEKLIQTEEYLGQLKSEKAVSLYPRVKSQVQNIYVKEGQQVTQGQLLIQLENSEQQAITSSYLYEKNASASDFGLAKKQFNRYKELFEQDLISKNQLDEYLNQYESAKEKYNRSKSNVGGVSSNLAYYSIRAPFSGTVGNLPVEVGDFVDSTTKLGEIANIQKLELSLNLPPDKVRYIKLKDFVNILDEQKKIINKCTVFFISPLVSQDTQTVLMKASCDNQANLLRTGEDVYVEIQFGESIGFLIPPSALKRYGNDYFVFLAEKNGKELVAKQIEINLGDLQDNQYQVIDGLQAGKQIIVKGVEKLQDGKKIIMNNH